MSKLYVVATPIGNLADISLRAIEVLMEVDAILCEDTRHSGKLLQHIGVDKKLIAYHDHSRDKDRAMILRQLSEGKNFALISDAGTPIISDPGYRLIKEAIAAEVQIVPIPGACAVIAALSASGLPSDRFSFLGFAPHKSREAFVESLKEVDGTIIFYESAERITDMFERLAVEQPDRQAVIAREMTKLHEEILRGSVAELLEAIFDRKLKGEITVLLSPQEKLNLSDMQIELQLKALLASETLRSAVEMVVLASGENRRRIYAIALKIRGVDVEGDC